MKDIFGNSKPVQIEVDEWWFNGRFIQKTNHPKLSSFVSFKDVNECNDDTQPHTTMKEATTYCLTHPYPEATHKPINFIKIN